MNISFIGALSFALLYLFKKTRSNVLTCQNNMGSLMNRGFLPFIVGGLLLGMVYVEVCLEALVHCSLEPSFKIAGGQFWDVLLEPLFTSVFSHVLIEFHSEV